jgi:hypothetical protein
MPPDTVNDLKSSFPDGLRLITTLNVNRQNADHSIALKF